MALDKLLTVTSTINPGGPRRGGREVQLGGEGAGGGAPQGAEKISGNAAMHPGGMGEAQAAAGQGDVHNARDNVVVKIKGTEGASLKWWLGFTLAPETCCQARFAIVWGSRVYDHLWNM